MVKVLTAEQAGMLRGVSRLLFVSRRHPGATHGRPLERRTSGLERKRDEGLNPKTAHLVRCKPDGHVRSCCRFRSGSTVTRKSKRV